MFVYNACWDYVFSVSPVKLTEFGVFDKPLKLKLELKMPGLDNVSDATSQKQRLFCWTVMKREAVQTVEVVVVLEQWWLCMLVLCSVVLSMYMLVRSSVLYCAACNAGQVQQLAYDKYLKEVMALLMTDKEFANKVHEAGTAIVEKVATFSTLTLIHRY